MKEFKSISQMVIERRGPAIVGIDGVFYSIGVPLFNEETKEIERIFEFSIVGKLPAWKGREIYRAPCLGEPSIVDMKRARKQAYAVCKKLEEKRREKINGS